MSGRLTREAYQRIVDEDLAWLEKQPRTLERDHIAAVLRNAVSRAYGPASEDERRVDGPAKAWLVWSNHGGGCWWRADERGYTSSIEQAGRYTLEEALRCCSKRSFDRSKGVRPEQLIPSPELLAELGLPPMVREP